MSTFKPPELPAFTVTQLFSLNREFDFTKVRESVDLGGGRGYLITILDAFQAFFSSCDSDM